MREHRRQNNWAWAATPTGWTKPGICCLAGLLGGLLAGCSDHKTKLPAAATPETARARYARVRVDSLRSDSVARSGEQLPGAILPTSRIVAYYGNPLHKRMGVLGEFSKGEMLRRLDAQSDAWRTADPATPVRPALHLIAVIADRNPGPDSLYRRALPDSAIQRVITWGWEHHALVFLDVQVGLSTLPAELPALEKYLRLPFVHLGIDPEFSMKTGRRPGTALGYFDAADVNYARQFLARIVSENKLPPKVLVVHRFRKSMVQNYQEINTDPRVQIVMHMDGWGTPDDKRKAYAKYIGREPVEYAGFKIFYKNDLKPKNSRLMTPREVAALKPDPLYIQYQ